MLYRAAHSLKASHNAAVGVTSDIQRQLWYSCLFWLISHHFGVLVLISKRVFMQHFILRWSFAEVLTVLFSSAFFILKIVFKRPVIWWIKGGCTIFIFWWIWGKYLVTLSTLFYGFLVMRSSGNLLQFCRTCQICFFFLSLVCLI